MDAAALGREDRAPATDGPAAASIRGEGNAREILGG
jgi:hypothetical protein